MFRYNLGQHPNGEEGSSDDHKVEADPLLVGVQSATSTSLCNKTIEIEYAR